MDLQLETNRRLASNQKAFDEGKISPNFYELNKAYYIGLINKFKKDEDNAIILASTDFIERLKRELDDFELDIYILGGMPFLKKKIKNN